MVNGLAILRVLHTRLAHTHTHTHLEWEIITGIISYSGENKVPFTADLFMAWTVLCWRLTASATDTTIHCAHEQDSTQAVHHFYGQSIKTLMIRSALTRQVRQLT